MEQLTQYLPYILNAAGGAVLAPLLTGLLGGKGLGGVVNIILGAAAGVGAGYGVGMTEFGTLLAGKDADPMAPLALVQRLLEGGVGGGVLGLILSFIKGK